MVLALLTLSSASAQDTTLARDPTKFTWVEEGVLAVGGGGLTEADVDSLYALGFRAIVDLRAEHEDPAAYIASKGMTFLDIPIDSAADINETQLSAFTEWARGEEEAGRPIYVHCTNGWHRAATFAVAWDLWDDRRDGKDPEPDDGYDEEAREQVAKRPGTVMRAQSALLDYYATLTHQPQVAVTLVSPLSRPDPNATMPVHVDVSAGGAPAANARVKVWSEESKLRIEGATDASGRFTFTYTAPSDGTFMDHLYARASVDGYADGADNVEFIFAEKAKRRGALEVTAERTASGIFVTATSNGEPVPARFVLTAPRWTAFEASAIGSAVITGAPADLAIDVRAVSWGSDGGAFRLGPPAPAQAEPPVAAPPPVAEPPARAEPRAPDPTPEPPLQTPGSGAPLAEDAKRRAFALRYAAAGVVGALALLGIYLLARRSGMGSE